MEGCGQRWYINADHSRARMEAQAVTTIADTLDQFLTETGPGNPRSSASPAAIIDLFQSYLDSYGYEDLTAFDRARFAKGCSVPKAFCQSCGPARPCSFAAILLRPWGGTWRRSRPWR